MTEAPSPTRKGPAAFRTISEASAELGVPQHVLRFWETRFAFISPMKRAGGRRFYRPQDLDVLRGVRVLLQEEGYTIKGVQKLHRDQGLKRLVAASGVGEAAAARLAAEIEAETAPPAFAGSPEEGGLEEVELAEPLVAAPQATSTTQVELSSPPSARPVLDTDARRRLAEVLSDLETTKAGIDALLQES